jgi:hypothetical protein
MADWAVLLLAFFYPLMGMAMVAYTRWALTREDWR